MRIALVTDAWKPQVNGVVTTLVELVAHLQAKGHRVELIEPGGFRTFPCPGYPEIGLAWRPKREVARRLDDFAPDAVHIATEGPLGGAARAHCLRRGWAFTTAFHTRFPDILARSLRVPAGWGYAWFRRFHRPSAGVMVPTGGMLKLLRDEHRFDHLLEWSHGVDLDLFKPSEPLPLDLPRPLFLYVGRVSWEKNLSAFLDLQLPGSKLVYGVGPLLDKLKAQHPEVHWRGVVPRTELPRIYSSADVFVMPSRSETFGLVMLEAMACGTPVAAYPEAGPLDVIGASRGGVLDTDLGRAAMAALDCPREAALARAHEFDWRAVGDQFLSFLTPAHSRSHCHRTDIVPS